MELTNSPMNERQRTYRQVYRDRIAAWYNGYLHVAIIYAIGFCALFVYLSHLQSVQWWEWLAIRWCSSRATSSNGGSMSR